MKRIGFTICILVATSIYHTQEVEDSTQLENIVIQGNRIQIPFSQSSRNIQIITQEEIARYPVKSINELLAYVGGVDLRQRGPFGTQADISIDGGSFEQTLVLLNGVKLINSQ